MDLLARNVIRFNEQVIIKCSINIHCCEIAKKKLHYIKFHRNLCYSFVCFFYHYLFDLCIQDSICLKTLSYMGILFDLFSFTLPAHSLTYV